MEPEEKSRFFEKSDNLFKLELKNVIIRSLSSPIMEFLGGIAIAFVIWYGGWEVIKGVSTPGKFISFLTCTLLLYDPVKKISRLNNAIQQGMAAADRIYDIIETPNEIADPPAPRQMTNDSHAVQFRQVSFSYGENQVLRDIDLTVDKGQVMALVGMSGGGKSTLVNLIPRFFDVSDGAVLIDGVDIREYAIGDLRGQIAIVTQEPILFNETVRYNIAYGNKTADDDQIVEAAKAAYAHDFIMQFPKAYDTVIGELGGRLSGGEKQRICIARALLKNAPHSDSGRSHILPGLRGGSSCPESAGKSDAWKNHRGNCPSLVDHFKSRPDCRHRRRRRLRTRYARRASIGQW